MLSCIKAERVFFRYFFHWHLTIRIMTHTKKFSAVVAVVVVGFLSIYATFTNFNSSNQTSYQLNITLDMQSGAQIPVSISPGQSIPTSLNGDAVTGLDYNGQHDPAGSNAVM